MDAIRTEHLGPLTIALHYDEDDPTSPRDWDNVGRFAGLRRWTFNDDDFAEPYRSAREEAGEPILAIPVKVLDGPYTIVRETGDWGYADGIYWAPLSKVQAEGFGDVAGLRACLRAEVAVLNQYLAGETYGYSVTLGDEIIDSCWGFIGEEEYAWSEGVSAAEDALAGLTPYVLSLLAAWDEEA